MKKVSIIIPCYNAEKTIERAIESVFIQDYEKIELIVVDDGSYDNSAHIIKRWCTRFIEKGWLLKYIYQENTGVGGATNTALKHVTGEYLTLLDADDRFLQGSIKKRVLFLENNETYAGVKSNGWIVRKEKKELFVKSEDEKRIIDLFVALIEGRTNNWAGTYMIKTKILFSFYKDREIFPSRYGQNLQLIMPVAYKRDFGYLDEPLMEYIIQDNSITQTEVNKYEKEEINSHGYKEIYDHMLMQIVSEECERSQYQKLIDASFFRSAMLRAITYNKRENIKTNFRRLKDINCCTLDDQIAFYGVFCFPIGYFLRCVRKGRVCWKLWRNRR